MAASALTSDPRRGSTASRSRSSASAAASLDAVLAASCRRSCAIVGIAARLIGVNTRRCVGLYGRGIHPFAYRRPTAACRRQYRPRSSPPSPRRPLPPGLPEAQSAAAWAGSPPLSVPAVPSPVSVTAGILTATGVASVVRVIHGILSRSESRLRSLQHLGCRSAGFWFSAAVSARLCHLQISPYAKLPPPRDSGVSGQVIHGLLSRSEKSTSQPPPSRLAVGAGSAATI